MTAKTPGTCRHCGLPTAGGDYLPGHNARHVANLREDVLYGRPLRDAMAELDGHHRLAWQLTAQLGLNDPATIDARLAELAAIAARVAAREARD